MNIDWASTCLPHGDGGAGQTLDSGWSPTRSLAVKNGRRSTHYYKAGDEVNGVREYDLQFLGPEKMPGKVDKDTVVLGMQDFARSAVEVASGETLVQEDGDRHDAPGDGHWRHSVRLRNSGVRLGLHTRACRQGGAHVTASFR